jgi:hypothetical protein
MADAAKWVTAAEAQLGWRPGFFMEAYKANREESNARVIDDDKVALEIISLSEAGEWSGTASQLMSAINPSGEPGFPQAANRLKRRLVELKPNLDAIGVTVQFVRQGTDSKKVIHIGKRVVPTAA